MQVVVQQADNSFIQQILYKRWLICALICASVALLGTVIMAITFPTYYYSLFHFNRKYSSIIEQSNDAMTNTGVIQTYLNECVTPIANGDTVVSGWCDNVIKNIKPSIIQYQTTKEQQKFQLQKILLQNERLIDNVFYCNNALEGATEPVYCVCNYINENDGVFTLQNYTKNTKLSFRSELTKFCKQSPSQASILDKKLISKITKFIEQ